MKTIFCPNCEQEKQTNIEQREETFTVKGEKISVPAYVLICSNCKNDIFDEELDSANIATAYNEYRKQHSLDTDIKALKNFLAFHYNFKEER